MPKTELADRSEDERPVDVNFLLGLAELPLNSRETYRIGDLAREFNVTLRTLRFYEDRGLLSPERRGTTRLYSRRDRTRLRIVLLLKTLGFSLTEAKQLIEVYDQPGGKRTQLEVALARFREQQEILLEQRREVDEALQAMDLSIETVQQCLDEMTRS